MRACDVARDRSKARVQEVQLGIVWSVAKVILPVVRPIINPWLRRIGGLFLSVAKFRVPRRGRVLEHFLHISNEILNIVSKTQKCHAA